MEPEHGIKVGDVVILKCGGPNMVVVESGVVHDKMPLITCAWADDFDQFWTIRIPIACVVRDMAGLTFTEANE